MSKVQDCIDNIRSVQLGPTEISVDKIVARVIAETIGARIQRAYRVDIITLHTSLGFSLNHSRGIGLGNFVPGGHIC